MKKEDQTPISRKEALKQLGSLALLPVASSSVIKSIYDATNKKEVNDKRPGHLQNKPNILIIMDDQHRGDFLGCAGADWIKTPNLDRLAAEGARFTNFYAAVPSCTPARTGLLTGLSPWNHGMLGYMNNIAQYYRVTMPQFFSEMGYYTVVYGKNHFGPPRNSNGYLTVELEEGWYSKLEKGFISDYEAFFKREAPGKDINATTLGYNDNRGGIPFPFEDRLHATHWTAARAIEFLEKDHNEVPWLLNVSFQRPHPPFDPPKRWMDFYKSQDIPKAKAGNWADIKYKGKSRHIYETPDAAFGIYPDDEVKASRAAYAGSISFIDEQIGKVIEALKKSGQYENTFIVFMSDHGEMLGDQHMWRKCRPYQPSINIPLIMRWPENHAFSYSRGQVRRELVELRDIFPTLADICGLTIPVVLDGQSILNIFERKGIWRKTLCLEHSQEYEPDNAWVAIRNERYKYVFFTLTGEEQFFDLENDPCELDNKANESNNSDMLCNLRNELIKELEVRGLKWVREQKLQVQKESLLVGDKFPMHAFNQHY